MRCATRLPTSNFHRYLGLSPDVPEQRARALLVLRALCKQDDTSAAAGSAATLAHLPLFGFNPASQEEPAEIGFFQKGPWAQDSKGAQSLRLHVQAIHKRAHNLVVVDANDEPALAQHPLKFKSWREALDDAVAHHAPPQHCDSTCEPPQQQSVALTLDPSAEALRPSLPSSCSNLRAFVFKCWPRMCDCACSVVHLS